MKLIGFIPGTSEEISKNAAMKKTISTNNENVSDFKNVINYYDFYIKILNYTTRICSGALPFLKKSPIPFNYKRVKWDFLYTY